MRQKPTLLLIKQLPPELAKRLEGSDTDVTELSALLLALQERQNIILQTGAKHIPSLAELFDEQFNQTTDSVPKPIS